MGKTGKVETVLSNDGKTRLKGNVGSQSTLVKQAKTPTTNINSVKIDTAKSKTNTVEMSLSVAEKEWEAILAANPDFSKALDELDKLKYGGDCDPSDFSEAFTEVEKLKEANPKFVKAEDKLIAAKIAFHKEEAAKKEAEATIALDAANAEFNKEFAAAVELENKKAPEAAELRKAAFASASKARMIRVEFSDVEGYLSYLSYADYYSKYDTQAKRKAFAKERPDLVMPLEVKKLKAHPDVQQAWNKATEAANGVRRAKVQLGNVSSDLRKELDWVEEFSTSCWPNYAT